MGWDVGVTWPIPKAVCLTGGTGAAVCRGVMSFLPAARAGGCREQDAGERSLKGGGPGQPRWEEEIGTLLLFQFSFKRS